MKRPLAVGLALGVLVVALLAAALLLGSTSLPPGDVVRALLAGPGGEASTTHTIVWMLRLPRALLALAVGGGLAVVGVAMQALLRNPLAEPYLLGVSAGASAGASIVALGFAPVMLSRVVSEPLAAALGALIAVGAVFAAARTRGGLSTARLLLAGVAASSLFAAVAALATFAAPDADRVRAVLFWLLGSLAATRWVELPLAMAATLIGAGTLWALARPLDAFLLGEDAAASLGVPVERMKRGLVVLTALVTGVLVAAAGAVGFVGLVVPHAVRFLAGAPHRRLVPLAMAGGAAFVLAADLAAQLALPGRELPLGVVTAVCGAPFFLWLLRRTDRLEG
ncbi:MAG TPA: iron ABC transporter permease [Rhodothermales bacterium]|nr:iron ABC transporter permease [Rhodothermales bacterium]